MRLRVHLGLHCLPGPVCPNIYGLYTVEVLVLFLLSFFFSFGFQSIIGLCYHCMPQSLSYSLLLFFFFFFFFFFCILRVMETAGTFSDECNIDWFNLYHSVGIFSKQQIDDIFLIFPSKQDLTFHANYLLRRQFA